MIGTNGQVLRQFTNLHPGDRIVWKGHRLEFVEKNIADHYHFYMVDRDMKQASIRMPKAAKPEELWIELVE